MNTTSTFLLGIRFTPQKKTQTWYYISRQELVIRDLIVPRSERTIIILLKI